MASGAAERLRELRAHRRRAARQARRLGRRAPRHLRGDPRAPAAVRDAARPAHGVPRADARRAARLRRRARTRPRRRRHGSGGERAARPLDLALLSRRRGARRPPMPPPRDPEAAAPHRQPRRGGRSAAGRVELGRFKPAMGTARTLLPRVRAAGFAPLAARERCARGQDGESRRRRRGRHRLPLSGGAGGRRGPRRRRLRPRPRGAHPTGGRRPRAGSRRRRGSSAWPKAPRSASADPSSSPRCTGKRGFFYDRSPT